MGKHTFTSPSETPDGTRDSPSLGEVIERIGFGPAQMRAGIVGGGVWLADGSELLLISSVTNAVAIDWDLGHAAKGMVVTVVFVGILIGNIMSGPIGDNYGRRHMIMASYAGIFIFSILSSYTTNVFELAIARLFVGASFGCGQPAWNTLNSELTPMWWRLPMNSFSMVLFVVGELYSAALMLYDDPNLTNLHWRWLLRMGAIPSAIWLVLSALLLVQSPNFLAVHGHYDEAVEVLESLKYTNGAHDVDTAFRIPPQPPKLPFLEKLQRQKEIVFGNHLFGSTCIVMFSCFTLNLMYYGTMYAFPQILPTLVTSTSAASELFVGALWELPGLALAVIIGTAFPRKLGMKIYMATSLISIATFIVGAVFIDHGVMLRVMMHLGYYGVKCFVSIGFISVYQYAVEIYPTEARITGTAVNIAGGRLAGILSPILYEGLTAFFHSWVVFMLVIGGCLLLNFLMVDSLPFETMGVHLKDTLHPQPSHPEPSVREASKGGVACS